MFHISIGKIDGLLIFIQVITNRHQATRTFFADHLFHYEMVKMCFLIGYTYSTKHLTRMCHLLFLFHL